MWSPRNSVLTSRLSPFLAPFCGHSHELLRRGEKTGKTLDFLTPQSIQLVTISLLRYTSKGNVMKIPRKVLVVAGALLLLGAISRKAVSQSGEFRGPEYPMSWQVQEAPAVPAYEQFEPTMPAEYPSEQFGPTAPVVYPQPQFVGPTMPVAKPVKRVSMPRRAATTVSHFGRSATRKAKSLGGWANRVRRQQLPRLARTVRHLGVKANKVMPYIVMLDRELGLFDAMMVGQKATDKEIARTSLKVLETSVDALSELEKLPAGDPQSRVVRDAVARELIGIAGGAYKNIAATKGAAGSVAVQP